MPDGKIIENWPWVITPDFVNVLAINKEKKFVCFRQTKYAVKGTSLAPVGGHIEPGEDPLTAAKRELLEETGYSSDEWVDLGNFITEANRGGSRGFFYLGLNAERIAEPDSDDLEEQELLLMSFEEIKQNVLKGEFKVLSWASGVLLAIQYLESNNIF